MTSRDVLPADEIAGALQGADLAGWKLEGGKLRRDYEFPNFVHAFGFMSMAATVIEAANHHPEWFNVYGRVTVELTTHDAGGVTAKDLELARALEPLALPLLKG